MSASHDDVMQAIGRLEGKVETMGKSVSSLGARMQAMEAIANQGKGALWMFIKIGAAVTVIGGGVAWLLGKMPA